MIKIKVEALKTLRPRYEKILEKLTWRQFCLIHHKTSNYIKKLELAKSVTKNKKLIAEIDQLIIEFKEKGFSK